MKIAYLSTQTSFYGGEVHLRQLACGMRERGHAVTCLVRRGSALAGRLAAVGIAVETPPLVDWYEPRTLGAVRAHLRRDGVDVLHAHTPRDCYIAAAAGLGTGATIVGTRHQLHAIGCAPLKRPFLRRLAAMIAVSEAVRAGLVRSRVIDPARIVTIPNGVDVRRPLPSRDGLRRRRGVDDAAPVVGFVGRLCPEKGVETLLRAARLLRDGRWPHLRVFIVGDDPRGGYDAHLQRLADRLELEGCVDFFGYVDDAARSAADFDVQVVASRAEPFGLATLEGMAHRHAVVATNAGGSREIIRDGEDGFLVPPGDERALAARLDLLLSRPDLRLRIGVAARRRVEEAFPLEAMLDRTEALYRRLRGGRGPSAAC